jgi:probable HAF family extracellular repeat protein
MNTTRSFIWAATLSAGLSFSLAASAANYTALDLGIIFPTGINNNGQVAGTASNPFVNQTMGVITGIMGQTNIFDVEFVGGINDSGQVAGTQGLLSYPPTAFFTGPNGVGKMYMSGLGGVGGNSASDINNIGQVVGSSYTASGDTHAFITGPSGVGLTDLGTVGGSESAATAVNNSGQVAGYLYRSDDTGPHAFFADPNGAGMVDLFAQKDEYSSYAMAINDAGQVAGFFVTASSGSNYDGHAFITGANGVGITDLGTLLGTDDSQAYGINASGWVVGTSIIRPSEPTGSYQMRAFIAGVDGAGMMDLTSFVNLANSHLTFSEARGINDLGQIVALANDGHAYLLSPVPEPESYALMLAGLGLVGCFARRKKQIS